MTEALRAYFLTVTGAALLVSVLLAVIPPGAVKKAAGFVSGLVMIAAVLGPLADLNLTDLAAAIAKVQMQSDAAASGIEVHSQEITAGIIADRSEEYIEDKAASLGAAVTAEVTVATDASYPYPASVVITGTCTALQKTLLSRYITENLAIEEEAQTWN